MNGLSTLRSNPIEYKFLASLSFKKKKTSFPYIAFRRITPSLPSA